MRAKSITPVPVEVGGVRVPSRGGGQALDVGEVAVGREERDRARRVDEVALADRHRVGHLLAPGRLVPRLRDALVAGGRLQPVLAELVLELRGGQRAEARVLDRPVADVGESRELLVERQLTLGV
jgi:hypothetical protein